MRIPNKDRPFRQPKAEDLNTLSLLLGIPIDSQLLKDALMFAGAINISPSSEIKSELHELYYRPRYEKIAIPKGLLSDLKPYLERNCKYVLLPKLDELHSALNELAEVKDSDEVLIRTFGHSDMRVIAHYRSFEELYNTVIEKRVYKMSNSYRNFKTDDELLTYMKVRQTLPEYLEFSLSKSIQETTYGSVIYNFQLKIGYTETAKIKLYNGKKLS